MFNFAGTPEPSTLQLNIQTQSVSGRISDSESTETSLMVPKASKPINIRFQQQESLIESSRFIWQRCLLFSPLTNRPFYRDWREIKREIWLIDCLRKIPFHGDASDVKE